MINSEDILEIWDVIEFYVGQHYTWKRISIRIDVLIFQLSKINCKTKLLANIQLCQFWAMQFEILPKYQIGKCN